MFKIAKNGTVPNHCTVTTNERPTSGPSSCLRANATGRPDTQFGVRTTWAILVLWPTLVSAVQVEASIQRHCAIVCEQQKKALDFVEIAENRINVNQLSSTRLSD